MSVRTTFDNKRDSAKENISRAIADLQECLKEDTWGYSDMKESFIDEMVYVMAELMKLKRKL